LGFQVRIIAITWIKSAGNTIKDKRIHNGCTKVGGMKVRKPSSVSACGGARTCNNERFMGHDQEKSFRDDRRHTTHQSTFCAENLTFGIPSHDRRQRHTIPSSFEDPLSLRALLVVETKRGVCRRAQW